MKKFFVFIVILVTAYSSYSQESKKAKILDISAGYFLGNDEITKKEFKQILSTNQKAFKEYKKGRVLAVTGSIVSSVSSFYLGWQIGTSLSGGQVETVNYIYGGIGVAVGLITNYQGNSLVKKSLRTYNGSVQEVSLNLKPTSNGIGLVLSF